MVVCRAIAPRESFRSAKRSRNQRGNVLCSVICLCDHSRSSAPVTASRVVPSTSANLFKELGSGRFDPLAPARDDEIRHGQPPGKFGIRDLTAIQTLAEPLPKPLTRHLPAMAPVNSSTVTPSASASATWLSGWVPTDRAASRKQSAD